MMPDSAERLSSALTGRYTIERKLGEGGMATVYLAEDVKHGRRVALKVLRPELAATLGPDRFLREVRVTANLRHPHVLPLFDSGEADGFLYYVMPYVEGESLRERLTREGDLPIADAVRILSEVVDALAEAHRMGVVHRDIKPDNVMLSGRHAAVTDFGVAKAVSDATGTAATTTIGLTLGTLAYMAPEQALADEHIDHRADIYSVGAMGYEMLTGRPPFPDRTPQQILAAHLTESPTPIAELRDGTPPGLNDILMRCLEKKPADRWQTAHELLSALEPYAASTIGAPPVPPRRRRLFRIAAAALLSAVLLVAGVELAPVVGSLLASRSAPSEQHLAVLPLQDIGGDASSRAFADGIVATLTSALSQLQQFHDSLWVVPTSEVLSHQVRSPDDANKLFGVNLAVTGNLQKIGTDLRLTLNLINAKTLRQLNSTVIDVAEKGVMALQGRAVISLLQMLDLQLDPTSSQILAAGNTDDPQAYQYYAQGRGYVEHRTDPNAVQKAIDAFTLAVQRDSTYAAAHAGLAQAYWAEYGLTKESDWVAKAVAEAELADSLDDRLAYVLTTLGRVHDGTGHYTDAVEDFKRALAIDPLSYEARQGLATAYEHEGRLDEAEQTYKRAIAMRPDDWSGYDALGVFYFNHARYDDAIVQFKKVTEINPKDYLGFSDLGGMYYMKGMFKQAARMWEKAFALGHQYTVASNLGTLYYVQGNYGKSARAFEEALQIDDHDYVIWGNLADAYNQVPEDTSKASATYARAVQMAEKARQVNPKDAHLLAQLGHYYAMLEDRAKALDATNEALALSPNSPYVMYHAGATNEELGDRKEAVRWLAKAIANGYSRAEIERQPELKELLASREFAKALADAKKNVGKGGPSRP
jgi:serine/threonine protein kinase/tetratricopeptide (TPR) repeat protein